MKKSELHKALIDQVQEEIGFDNGDTLYYKTYTEEGGVTSLDYKNNKRWNGKITYLLINMDSEIYSGFIDEFINHLGLEFITTETYQNGEIVLYPHSTMDPT